VSAELAICRRTADEARSRRRIAGSRGKRDQGRSAPTKWQGR